MMSAVDAVITFLLVLILVLIAGSALSLVRWALHWSDEDWTEEGHGRRW